MYLQDSTSPYKRVLILTFTSKTLKDSVWQKAMRYVSLNYSFHQISSSNDSKKKIMQNWAWHYVGSKCGKNYYTQSQYHIHSIGVFYNICIDQ